MFTDKQSLILCAIVVFGFSISGIIGILDNYVVVAVLLILFILIVINLFMKISSEEYSEEDLEIESKKKNSNILSDEYL